MTTLKHFPSTYKRLVTITAEIYTEIPSITAEIYTKIPYKYII